MILTTKPTKGQQMKISRYGSQLTNMEDGRGELNVPEMAWADLDVFFARRARELAVDRAELWVVEALLTRLLFLLVHSLGVDDVNHAHGLDLLG